MRKSICIETHSPDATERFGEALARHLRPRDCLILLGGFGVGKTTFVKGLAKGLGVHRIREVASPSFVMLKIYEGRMPLYHFDLYRLSTPGEVQRIGWDEFVEADGVTAIEWPQAAGPLLPSSSLKVRFAILGDQDRRIEVEAADGRGSRFLKRLARSCKKPRTPGTRTSSLGRWPAAAASSAEEAC